MRNLSCFIVLLLFVACSGDSDKKKSQEGLTELNLLEYGVPLSIQAPEGAVVDKSTIGLFDDITVSKGDFNLQILALDATTSNMETILNDEKESVSRETYFSKFVEENPRGFIYQTVIDSTESYDFRYLHVQADRLYKFQAGLLGSYSREEIQRMMEAVEQ